jgi:hypothetical protein
LPKKFKKDCRIVEVNKENSFTSRLVISNGNGSKNPSNCWNLLTNLYDEDFIDVIKFYAYRMRVEESFKDKKDVRNGMKFKGLRLSTPERYDRMLLLFAYAYTILTFIGIWAENERIDRSIRANTSKERAFALWRLGHYCFMHLCINWSCIRYGMNNAILIE